MRVVIKGWFGPRELSHAEAEAHCLRQAAKLAGSPFVRHQEEQARLLDEAQRNRAWGAFGRAVKLPEWRCWGPL